MGTLIGEARGVYPVAVEVFLDGYSGPYRHIAPLIWKSGWLRVSEVELATPYKTWRGQLVACVTDHGETVPAYIAARMFEMPASAPKEVEHTPPDELDEVTDALYWDFLGRCDRMALSELEEASAAAERSITGFERKAERAATAAELRIKALRQKLRGFTAATDTSLLRDTIRRLDAMVDRIPAALASRIAEVRRTVSELEARVTESIGLEGEVQELFSVYWITRPRWRGRRLDRVPEVVEAPYTAWAARPAGGERSTYDAPAEASEAAEHSEMEEAAPRAENRGTSQRERMAPWASRLRAAVEEEPADVDDAPFDEAYFQRLLELDAERELRAVGRLKPAQPQGE